MGHKISLISLKLGAPIVRYGEVIGYANQDLEVGSWMHTGHMNAPEAPSLNDVVFLGPEKSEMEPLEGYTFEGYRNRDGSVGTKNVLVISTSVQCVAGMLQVLVKRIKAELLSKYPYVDDVVGLRHNYGCGVAIDAPGAIIPIRTLQNIARNPNFGDEVMVLGLGCEKLRPSSLTEM